MTALQLALDAIELYRSQDPLTHAKCSGLMIGYDARWRTQNYVTTDVERYVEAPLVNPETQRPSRTFKLAGKIDVLASRDGRPFIIDHKTTSSDITDPNSAYWRQLAVEGQPSHYMLLEWLNGRKVDGAVWDVVRKPGISPKKLSKADRTAIVSSGRYFDQKILESDRVQLSNGFESETPTLYSLRLAADTQTRPEWYFARKPVPRLDHELAEYAAELWDHSQDLIATRRSERNPRNSGACLLYNSPCVFLGVCSGHDDIDSDRWTRRQFVHRELPETEGDGRDLLTNSRIRVFQTCKRKHLYQYELGVERFDDEERESLYFGRIWHEAQEAWWTFFKESAHEHGNTSCPAIGVAQQSAGETVVPF